MDSTFAQLRQEQETSEAVRFVLDRHCRLNLERVELEDEKALVDRMSAQTIEDLSSLRLMVHMLILQNETGDNDTEELCRYIFSKLEPARPFVFDSDDFKMHALRLQADLEENAVLLPRYFSDRDMDSVLLFVWEIIEMLESDRVLARGPPDSSREALFPTMVLDAAVYGSSYTVFMRKREDRDEAGTGGTGGFFAKPATLTRKRARKVTMLVGVGPADCVV